MASEVDICNLGIGHLGHSRQITAISPPDGSVEASLCATFYPIARNTMLEAHNWGFATKRVALASLGTPPDGWAYRYAWPNKCLKIQALFHDESDVPQEYDVEADATGTVILTNIEDAQVKYTAVVTDVNKFTSTFETSLSTMLASFLSGPIIKGKAGRASAKELRAEALGWVGQARLDDANGRRRVVKTAPGYERTKLEPASIRARR